MEYYSRARGQLPPELAGLLTSQMNWAIDEANLGISDREIARRYLVDRMPMVDIGAEVGLDRSTVSKRLKQIRPRVSDAARSIPQ